MKILVTGAAGGIGSVLCMALKKAKHFVVGYDNFNNGYQANLFHDGTHVCHTVVEGDIRDTNKIVQTLEMYGIDAIIHLAAISALPVCESNPGECMSVNVGGTASVLDAARTRACKVIFASTSAIYENTPQHHAPFRESAIVEPRLLYPLSKKLAEEVVKSYIENYNMDVTTLRFFNVFGPRQDIHRPMPPLINYIVRSVKRGEPLNFYSDGNQVRDYVHVDDVASIIERCLTEGGRETFNVCTGQLVSVRDIVGWAEEAFGPLQYSFNPSGEYWGAYPQLLEGPRPLDQQVIEREVNKFAQGSFEKAEMLLGWTPRTDIKQLMIETMQENYRIMGD